jgi:Flp pilus assembly protein TadB
VITIELFACVGLIAGAFLLLGLSPLEFSDGLFSFLLKRPKNIRDEINEATKRKKGSLIRRIVAETQEILRMTGKAGQFSFVCAASLLFFALGACAAILMENIFLVPVLATGLAFLPFLYIRATAEHFKKNVSAELETALSIITTAYLRNEDLLTSVEENLPYLNPPVKTAFAEFAARVRIIDPDMEAAIRDMKPKIRNEVFQEWCDAVAACQFDRSLKSTLTPIVSKLSDMRVVNAELEYLVFEPRKEFIIMALLVVGNLPLMYFLNRNWYAALMHSLAGQIVMAVCAAAIFICGAFVVKLTKPIRYRR